MSKRILVIDDDEFVRKSFTLALSGSGYEVDTAESGEKGIEKAGNERYDLIYLDLKMPGLNGVETLRELRKRDRDIPIYIVTAFYGEFFEELQEAINDGLDFEVLTKALSSAQITGITKGILEGAESI
ncbi:MAG: response regulator [Dehalococcoidia bacterium]